MIPLSGNGVMNNIVTLLMPFSGILIALRVVTDRFNREFLDDLHRAHSAQRRRPVHDHATGTTLPGLRNVACL